MRATTKKVLTGIALTLGLVACRDAGSSGAATSTTTSAGPIPVTVDDHGFTPSAVSFKKGEKGQLVFTRTTDDTCAKEVVFPEINVTKPLPLKQPVTIDVPTTDARTLTFQCGMGMYKSKVVVN